MGIDVEKQSAKQKAIDDWLPITASRNAKWWYSAFHNVTAMVGAGVLSLPYAMSQLGWYISFVFLCQVLKSYKTYLMLLQGSRDCDSGSIMDYNVIHLMANGGNA